MTQNPIWSLPPEPPPEKIADLAVSLSVPPLIARLLWRRGIRDSEGGERFLRPSLEHLHDPFLLTGMEAAVERILRAFEEDETIGIFGDFDVDGVTSAALLDRVFRRIARPPVCRLPHRLNEGYGLSRAAVEDLAGAGVRLLITVDSGVTSHDSIAYARGLGLDCIITDHHETKEKLPDALAVIDPKQAGCEYPDPNLVGVGLAWKLADALASRGAGERDDLLADLDLVAVGTVADVAPLNGENRVLVREGLARLGGTEKPGLRHLIRVAGFAGREVDYAAIAFGLAPRLNAAGRIADPAVALELLTTESEERAAQLAFDLDRANQERKVLDASTLQEALARLGGEKDPGAIVLASPDWHPGVIGIVASRLKEMFGRPAVLIALDGGVGRGSARSLSGFPLHEALERCSDLLLRHGGHALAAGLSIEEERIEPFRERFRALFREVEDEVSSPGSLTIEGALGLEECDRTLFEAIGVLRPFGPGNRKPIFLAQGVTAPEGFRRVGRNHLKFRAGRDGLLMDAIAFQVGHEAADRWREWGALDLAFTLEENRWGGETRLQLNVKGVRPGRTA
ncbi:MAG: single-stranded-DNA-specific exonuclease RecJ [Candidatus Eisenbacteria bacterium]|nr:single-stranded-DNA-specific exonuclease RecJ [Candidatus Eisenbacteria bacterium]